MLVIFKSHFWKKRANSLLDGACLTTHRVINIQIFQVKFHSAWILFNCGYGQKYRCLISKINCYPISNRRAKRPEISKAKWLNKNCEGVSPPQFFLYFQMCPYPYSPSIHCHWLPFLTAKHSYLVSFGLGWSGAPGSPQTHLGMGASSSIGFSLVWEVATA